MVYPGGKSILMRDSTKVCRRVASDARRKLEVICCDLALLILGLQYYLGYLAIRLPCPYLGFGDLQLH
jgi:hypothetical protein